MDQRDTNYGGYQQPQQPGPAPQQPKKKGGKLGCGCLGAVGLFVVVIVAVTVAGGGKSSNNTASNTTVTTVTTATAAAAGGDDAAATQAAQTPAAPAVNPEVTYSCTGSAGDGVNITYGPSGSDYSASSLPFTKTMSLAASAEYYDTEAQLQGGGSVSCTTTVIGEDGSTTTNTAAADGGYNIASAEVCSNFDGSWTDC